MAQFNDTLKEVLVKKHPVNAEFAQFTAVYFLSSLSPLQFFDDNDDES